MRLSVLLPVIYLSFVSLGLPDGVFGVAWPSMRNGLAQPLAAAGLVTTVLTLCSAVSGFASGAVVRRWGTGRVVAASGLLTGLALLGFAQAPTFAVVLLLAVPLGLGAGSVDAGLNHFVARHYSSRHMIWLHGCWGVGATIGPLAMGLALASSGGWRLGYQALGAAQLALGVLLLAALPLWRRAPEIVPPEPATTAAAAPPRATPSWAQWLAPSVYLFYALVEIGTGLWAASVLVEARGLAAADAGAWVAGFFGAITGGRFLLGLISTRVGNRQLARGGLALAFCGAAVFAVPGMPPVLGAAGLVLLGLGCAPVYPALMHETTRRFDAATARRVIGRQVAFAYIGGAFGPALLGVLGARLGLDWVMPVVVLGVLILALMVWTLDRVT